MYAVGELEISHCRTNKHILILLFLYRYFSQFFFSFRFNLNVPTMISIYFKNLLVTFCYIQCFSLYV